MKVGLAAVLAEPIPKASKGRLIVGKSHAAGGTLIEAEGGEAIINKRSVDLFAPLLSAINEAGGGVPFTRPFSDGGYFARNSSAAKNITLKEMQKALSESVSQIRIVDSSLDRRHTQRGCQIHADTRPCKLLKAHEVISLIKIPLEKLRDGNINPACVEYLEMYHEYGRMCGRGLKTTYIVSYLCGKYKIGWTKFFELMRGFDEEV